MSSYKPQCEKDCQNTEKKTAYQKMKDTSRAVASSKITFGAIFSILGSIATLLAQSNAALNFVTPTLDKNFVTEAEFAEFKSSLGQTPASQPEKPETPSSPDSGETDYRP